MKTPITDPAIATRDYPVKNARWAWEKGWDGDMRMVLWAVSTHWRIEIYDSGKFTVSGNPPAEAMIAAGCLHRGIPTPWAAAKELDAWEMDVGLQSDPDSRSASVAFGLAARIVRGESTDDADALRRCFADQFREQSEPPPMRRMPKKPSVKVDDE